MFRLTLTWTKSTRWYLDSRPALAAWWVVALVVLEVLGRTSRTDVGDGLGVLILAGLVVLTVRHHRRDPLGLLWQSWLRFAGAMRWIRARIPTVGVDLRTEPAVQRGFPQAGTRLLVASAAIVVALVVTRSAWPSGVRDTLRAFSGTASIVFVAAVWSVLAFGAFFFVAFTLGHLHDSLLNRAIPRPRRSRIEAAFTAATAVVLIICSTLLPAWIPLAAVGGLFASTAFLLGAPSEPLLMWRVGDSPHRVAAWVAWQRWFGAVATLLIIGLALVATGNHLNGGAPTSTPITNFVGSATAWAGVLAMGIWTWLVPILSFRLRQADPGTTIPPRVALSGAISEHGQEALRGAGFRLEASRHGPDPVWLEFNAGAPRLGSPESARLTRWPLPVHPSDADDPELHRRIRRRDDVQRRRQLMRGLRTIFKRVSQRSYEQGTGFWVAPHYWFSVGLGRDTNERDSWSVGPPYRAVIPLAARSHLAKVLDAVDIDLIFVEDRVPFRHLKRVFWVLFDLYDIFGRSTIEEHHFTGVPGLRVMIHDFTIGDPLDRDGYAEPDYDEIGRARILHVYRDRGEDSETADDPVLGDLVPEPASA